MPIPRVAIVGRPNAGKSSLMNMIAGAKVSIVDPTPGVTRDRVAAIVDLRPPDDRLPPKPVEFVDTGGFGVYTAEGGRFDEVGADLSKLTSSIEFQIGQAVDSADLILFAIDCQAGVTPADKVIAQMLRAGGFDRAAGRRKSDSPARRMPEVRIVATKCDGPKWEAHAYEAAGLGFGEPLMCSAKNNYMRREFLDTIYSILPEPEAEQKRPHADLMLAIIGKRNAGKSTLVNTLAGEQRVIVSEIAGTTRDAVDVRFEMDGRSLVAIDTAGLRRKKSFQDAIEHYAFDRAQRAVERADVILLLLDATEKISQVDEQLAALAQRSYKPTIVVVTKWDVAEGLADHQGRPATPERYEDYIRKELRAMWFAPISFVAGQTGRNVRNTINLAFEMKQQAEERVTTGKLNRLVRAIIDTQGPTDTVGTQAKVYYVAQTGICPPTITMVVNHPDLFRPNYIRFLMNRFREELPFKEIPMRIVVRARRQREADLATTGGTGEEGHILIKRGRKGVDELARRRTQELVGRDGESRGTIPSDAALLAQFDQDLSVDDQALAEQMLGDTEEFDTGYDDAVERNEVEAPELAVAARIERKPAPKPAASKSIARKPARKSADKPVRRAAPKPAPRRASKPAARKTVSKGLSRGSSRGPGGSSKRTAKSAPKKKSGKASRR
jgi:GTPase